MCPILRDSDLRVRKETHNVFSCLISWRRGVVGYSFTLFQALATAADMILFVVQARPVWYPEHLGNVSYLGETILSQ